MCLCDSYFLAHLHCTHLIIGIFLSVCVYLVTVIHFVQMIYFVIVEELRVVFIVRTCSKFDTHILLLYIGSTKILHLALCETSVLIVPLRMGYRKMF